MLSLHAGYTNTCKPLSRCAIYSKLSTIPDLWKPSGDDIRGNGHVQAYQAFCGYFLDFTAYIAGELVDRANVQGKVPQGYQHWQSSNPPKDQSSWLLISDHLFFTNESGNKEHMYISYFDYAKQGKVPRRYYQSRLALALTEVGTFSVFPFGKGRTDLRDRMRYDTCDFPFCRKLPSWFRGVTQFSPSPTHFLAPANRSHGKRRTWKHLRKRERHQYHQSARSRDERRHVKRRTWKHPRKRKRHQDTQSGGTRDERCPGKHHMKRERHWYPQSGQAKHPPVLRRAESKKG